MIESKARWIKKNPPSIDDNIDLPISTIVKQLLVARGINDTLTAKKFLAPNIEDLYDPFLFPQMKKAVERIERAIHNEERILIFGDYDADGVTSTSLLMEALREKDAVVDFYIPNRFTEGYGPNEAAFRQAKEANVSLIITVDTGIAAVHEAKVAKQLGIDLIITDHHEEQDELPDAYAIIHPKLADNYPFDDLAGVGVTFKLAHALLGEVPLHLIELAAIGTVADLVTLVDENRVIVYYGLKALTSTNRPGIKALKSLAGIKEQVTEEHIGFAIGPRLNAVGRLQDASLAVELLLERDEDIAVELGNEVQALNEERQKIVADITEEAVSIIEENNYDMGSVLVVGGEGWNPGVVGIVASRLVNTYNKPAIVLGINDEKGVAKGSARSIEAFNLFVNCMEVKDLFVAFGGHAQAAGMTLPIENVEQLRLALNERANKSITEEDFVPVLKIDQEITINELDIETIEEIEKLAPFGMGNPKPLFQVDNEIPSDIRQIGSKLNHLKMSIKREGALLDVIGFGHGDLFLQLSPKSPISIVGELGINEWNGRKKIQLMLKDLKVSEWQLFDFRGSVHSVKQLTKLRTNSIVAIHFHPIQANDSWLSEFFPLLSVEEASNSDFIDGKELLIIDLPSKLEELTNFIKDVSPKKIYVYFKMNQQNYVSHLPNREHFKQFYAFIMKQEKLKIQDRLLFARSRGWSKEFIDFIIKVFLDLQFVKIENGFILYNSSPMKHDLTESKTYQQKLEQIQVERTLYYSTYDELKNWFNDHLRPRKLEEAHIHGL